VDLKQTCEKLLPPEHVWAFKIWWIIIYLEKTNSELGHNLQNFNLNHIWKIPCILVSLKVNHMYAIVIKKRNLLFNKCFKILLHQIEGSSLKGGKKIKMEFGTWFGMSILLNYFTYFNLTLQFIPYLTPRQIKKHLLKGLYLFLLFYNLYCRGYFISCIINIFCYLWHFLLSRTLKNLNSPQDIKSQNGKINQIWHYNPIQGQG